MLQIEFVIFQKLLHTFFPHVICFKDKSYPTLIWLETDCLNKKKVLDNISVHKMKIYMQ
jgi:hypothetical protein